MTRLLLTLALLAVLLLVAVWGLQRRLIYFPSTGEVPPAAQLLPAARDVVLETSDGLRLGAWYVPAQRRDRGFTVLVAHGNAGDRASRAPLAQALAEQGLSVLLFDYRGYGGNAGSPSSDGLALDVRAARRWLVETADVPADRLLYFGESLGAAVVAELATEHPPAGMLLRSPFADLASLGRVHYPWVPVGLLLRDSYPVVDQVREIDVPVTVVYGTADTIVPPEQSRMVAAAAAAAAGPVRRVSVEGADHNDPVLLEGAVVVEAVTALAERAR